MKRHWYFCFTVTNITGDKIFATYSGRIEAAQDFFPIGEVISRTRDFLYKHSDDQEYGLNIHENFKIHITNNFEISHMDYIRIEKIVISI